MSQIAGAFPYSNKLPCYFLWLTVLPVSETGYCVFYFVVCSNKDPKCKCVWKPFGLLTCSKMIISCMMLQREHFLCSGIKRVVLHNFFLFLSKVSRILPLHVGWLFSHCLSHSSLCSWARVCMCTHYGAHLNPLSENLIWTFQSSKHEKHCCLVRCTQSLHTGWCNKNNLLHCDHIPLRMISETWLVIFTICFCFLWLLDVSCSRSDF